MTTHTQEAFIELLKAKLGHQVLSAHINLGDIEIRVDKAALLDIFRILKLDAELKFDMFLSVTAVDWMDQAQERFELVYHLLSLQSLKRIRVKVWIPEGNTNVDTATSLWSGANFMEREVFDMYGIDFQGHPDLRRILLYDEFVGYPLRKDYPVQAKQPRIPLRYPEVRNTAVDMKRPPLVSINKRNQDNSTRKVA